MMHKFMQIKPLILSYDNDSTKVSLKLSVKDDNDPKFEKYPISIISKAKDGYEMLTNMRLDELKEIQEWADWVVRQLEGSAY